MPSRSCRSTCSWSGSSPVRSSGPTGPGTAAAACGSSTGPLSTGTTGTVFATSFGVACGGMETITIVGGGIAGLTAAITSAEAGAPVVLYDVHGEPGGRARSLDAPYRANLGPHVLYSDGPLWAWLKEHDLLPPSTGIPYTGLRLRWGGAIHRTPPLTLIPSVLKLRGRRAPVDEPFRTWAA